MGVEIERKFLVPDPAFLASLQGTVYRQGYLAERDGVVVRVRTEGERARLTVKGPSHGAARAEFEYAIPMPEALQMLGELCGAVVHKTRYEVPVGDHVWEVDVFHGDNAGLVLAEVELDAEDEAFELPSWAGEEVTADGRYYNVSLARHPFRSWGT